MKSTRLQKVPLVEARKSEIEEVNHTSLPKLKRYVVRDEVKRSVPFPTLLGGTNIGHYPRISVPDTEVLPSEGLTDKQKSSIPATEIQSDLRKVSVHLGKVKLDESTPICSRSLSPDSPTIILKTPLSPEKQKLNVPSIQSTGDAPLRQLLALDEKLQESLNTMEAKINDLYPHCKDHFDTLKSHISGLTSPVPPKLEISDHSNLEKLNAGLKSEVKRLQERLEVSESKEMRFRDALKSEQTEQISMITKPLNGVVSQDTTNDRVEISAIIKQNLEMGSLKLKITELTDLLRNCELNLQTAENKTRAADEKSILLKEELERLALNIQTTELSCDTENASRINASGNLKRSERLEFVILENKKLTDRVEELNLELELVDRNDPVDTPRISDSLSVHRLTDALIKLRDVSHLHESELKDRIRNMETIQQKHEDQEAKNAELQAHLGLTCKTIEHLKGQLDIALRSESIILELTEKTLENDGQVSSLQAAIADLETLRRVSNDLEQFHLESSKVLSCELAEKESVIRTLVERYRALSSISEDHQKMILKFQNRVYEMENELSEARMLLKSRSANIDGEPSMHIETDLSNSRLKIVFLDYRASCLQFELDQSRTEVCTVKEFLCAEIPACAMDSLHVVLAVGRLKFQSELISIHLTHLFLTSYKDEGVTVAEAQLQIEYFRATSSKLHAILSESDFTDISSTLLTGAISIEQRFSSL